jgi:hypothetical protein
MEVIVMSTEKQERSSKGASGLVFVGCLMLGLAVGLFTQDVAVALLGAIGVGFIAMALMRFATGQW